MPNTEILARLRELHEELSAINDNLKSVEHVDDETVDALGQLVSDACVLVDQAKEANEDETPLTEGHDLMDRIVKFDSDHPRVSRFLSQMTDVLALMGI